MGLIDQLLKVFRSNKTKADNSLIEKGKERAELKKELETIKKEDENSS